MEANSFLLIGLKFMCEDDHFSTSLLMPSTWIPRSVQFAIAEWLESLLRSLSEMVQRQRCSGDPVCAGHTTHGKNRHCDGPLQGPESLEKPLLVSPSCHFLHGSFSSFMSCTHTPRSLYKIQMEGLDMRENMVFGFLNLKTCYTSCNMLSISIFLQMS